MRRKITLVDFIIYLVSALAMILAMMMATFKIAEVKFSNYKIIILLAAITFIYCFFVDKIKYFLLLLTIIFFVPKPLYIINFFKGIFYQWNDFYNSFYMNQYIDNSFGDYFIHLMYIAAVILAIFMYLLITRKKTLAIVTGGSILFAVYYFISENDIFNECSIFLCTVLFLYSYSNYTRKRDAWQKSKAIIRSRHFIKWFIAAVLLIVVSRYITTAFAYDVKPASFDWFEKHIVERFEDIGGREYKTLSYRSLRMKFNFTKTGYQQNSQRLGGAVKIDNSIAFKLSGNGNLKDLHLRGTVKDTYNGYIWKKADASTIKYKPKYSLNTGNYNIPSVNYTITIDPVTVETSTVFNPLYPLKVENKWEYYFVDSDSEIYHPGIAREGKPYKVTYKEYDVKSYNLSSEGTVKYDDSLKKYLQLSDTIPQRVYDLTDDIILKYKTNPYLTVSSIEKYLKKNYPYSLDTGSLPQGRDFVDYFLFDEKKGSCTYYATAMAVMCRIAGIPARYVEGYDVPDYHTKDGYIEVSNASAHAWVEVYFENAGWVVFDPTPGHNSAAEEAQLGQETTNPQENQSTPQINNENKTHNNEKEPLDENETGSKGGKRTGNSYSRIIYISLLFLLILLLIGLYNLINSVFLKGERFVSYSLYKIMLYGRLIYVPYKKGNTIREYMEKLNSDSELNLDKYISLYEMMLYSNGKLNELQKRTVHNAIKTAKEKAVKMRGRSRVFISDFIGAFMYLFRLREI